MCLHRPTASAQMRDQKRLPLLQIGPRLCFRTISWVVASFVWSLSPTIFAQSSAEPPEIDLSLEPLGLDHSPWISPRAMGMSEAIAPIADGLEAPFYNPA